MPVLRLALKAVPPHKREARLLTVGKRVEISSLDAGFAIGKCRLTEMKFRCGLVARGWGYFIPQSHHASTYTNHTKLSATACLSIFR